MFGFNNRRRVGFGVDFVARKISVGGDEEQSFAFAFAFGQAIQAKNQTIKTHEEIQMKRFRTLKGNLCAPFVYFGGKSLATEVVWKRFGVVANYIEPFCGSAAMLLGRPNRTNKDVETINDLDGFVANFWRAVAKEPKAVAEHSFYPCNHIDLTARHRWLVGQHDWLKTRLIEDHEYYNTQIAGYWVWGLSIWIAGDWCVPGSTPGQNGDEIVVNRRPNLCRSVGLQKACKPEIEDNLGAIVSWLSELQDRLKHVRVTSVDWKKVTNHCVSTYHGLTAIFLDPPYTNANLDYPAGGVGGPLADEVRQWCLANGGNRLFRIVLCGHEGEHGELLKHGWFTVKWKAHKGFATTQEARSNVKKEILWCSPYCVGDRLVGV